MPAASSAVPVTVRTPHGMEAEELVGQLSALGLGAPVTTSAAFDVEADAAARQLAKRLLDQSPSVVRREVAAYARQLPRRRGLVAEYAFDADAVHQAEALRGDPDADARLRRLLDAAGAYGVIDAPISRDEARHRTLEALRGRRRTPFAIAWHRLLQAAKEIDDATATTADRIVTPHRDLAVYGADVPRRVRARTPSRSRCGHQAPPGARRSPPSRAPFDRSTRRPDARSLDSGSTL